MLKTRYIMVGGFLGAGKTTAILRAAQRFQTQGLRVGLITNDQSHGLVDTAMLASHGFPTEEISGGCFCCRFNNLIEASERLDESTQPDLFLAEPVGSCTDLVATVVYPLKKIYGERYTPAPLSVLVDPIRVQRVLGLLPGKTFSPKVNYIYDRQLAEADLIVVNKIDLLEPHDRQRLDETLRRHYPHAQVIMISARTGEGFEAWLEAIEAGSAAAGEAMDVDYDTYADGEALLGWLNMTIELQGNDFDGNRFLLDFLTDLKQRLQPADGDAAISIAHLKATLTPDQGNDLAVANLVREDSSVEQAYRLVEPLSRGILLLNLRAEEAPERMQAIAHSSLQAVVDAHRLQHAVRHQEAFRPSRPTPTHRFAVG